MKTTQLLLATIIVLQAALLVVIAIDIQEDTTPWTPFSNQIHPASDQEIRQDLHAQYQTRAQIQQTHNEIYTPVYP